MVIWLVGMSGAGKSTIGGRVYAELKKTHSNTVLVDGDVVRKMFGHDSKGDYTVAARRKSAYRIRDLCLWLDRQGINVVCPVLCIFADILDENRNIYSQYHEVFVKAPMSVLEQRDTKGLYAAARAGTTNNVVGVDITFSEPKSAHLVVDTSVEHDIEVIGNTIINQVKGQMYD